MSNQSANNELTEAIRLRFRGSYEVPSKELTTAGGLAVISLIVQHGFVLTADAYRWLNWGDVLLAVFFFTELWRLIRGARNNRVDVIRRHGFELGVLGLFVLALFALLLGQWTSAASLQDVLALLNLPSSQRLFFWLVEAFLLVNICVLLLRFFQRIIVHGLRPEWLLAGSFGMLILLGTLLLLLPRATVPDKPLTLMEAVFMSTSAACVTGMAIRDVGTDFTTFGQMILMALFQVGGLGIVTFVAFVSVFSARSLPVSQMVAFRQIINAPILSDLKRSIAGIVLLTLAIEAAGVFALYYLAPASDAFNRFKWSVFHSVSAFSNAGFALQSNSLEPWRHDAAVNIVIMVLIILGGIGFLVLPEILRWALAWLGRISGWLRWRAPFLSGFAPVRLSIQTQLSLRVTLWLLIAGFVGFWFLESKHSLQYYTSAEGILVSMFQSVATRTAGFNTVVVGDLQPATLILVMVLMVIGACPVSAGGGIKTVTFGILLLALRAMILRKERVEVFGRTLPARALMTALSVFVLYIMAAVICLFLVAAFDPHIPFRSLMFEVIGALSTTGLSTGITADLSPASQLVLCAAMFVGRVGPISLVVSVFQSRRQVTYEFPEEEVVVG